MRVRELKYEDLLKGFCVYVPEIGPEKGNLVIIEKGAGDDLYCPGESEHYEDYVNWYSFTLSASGEPGLNEYDGGMFLYKETCDKIPMRRIVMDVLDQMNINPNVVDLVTVIETTTE